MFHELRKICAPPDGPSLLDDAELAVVVADAEVVAEEGGIVELVAGPPEHPEFDISPLGYVRGFGHPHFGKVVGLVNYKRDGRSVFANCHLHPKCSMSAGIMRADIPTTWMASWLIRGKPTTPEMSREQKLQFGQDHRDDWARPDAPA